MILKKSTLEDTSKRKLKCEKCGVYFYCCSSSIKKCWCFEYPIVDISKDIKDCICQECLKKIKRK